MRKLNSCCHDIHVFMPARRQFSVQTGVIWKGVRGIRLDTETAECHRRTDILGGKKQKKQKEIKRKEKKEGEKKKETSPIKHFCQKKATHFFGRLKSQIKQKREKQRNGHFAIKLSDPEDYFQ